MHIGTVPMCRGCLPPYPYIHWSMSVYQNETNQLIWDRAGNFESEEDCQEAEKALVNPDIYAICRQNVGSST
jgi:hypothetical protein